jgi:hypothetical protein
MTSEAGRDAKTYHGRRGGRRIQLHEAGAPAPAADRPQSPPEPEGGEGEAPHYHGHRERLGRASGKPALAPSPITNSSN